MCLCARMLALKWKGRTFIEIVNSRCFRWFPAALLVDQNCPPIWWRLYNYVKHFSKYMYIVTQKLWATKTWNLDKLFIYWSPITFIFLASCTGRFPIYFLCRVYCVTVKMKNWSQTISNFGLKTDFCEKGALSNNYWRLQMYLTLEPLCLERTSSQSSFPINNLNYQQWCCSMVKNSKVIFYFHCRQVKNKWIFPKHNQWRSQEINIISRCRGLQIKKQSHKGQNGP